MSPSKSWCCLAQLCKAQSDLPIPAPIAFGQMNSCRKAVPSQSSDTCPRAAAACPSDKTSSWHWSHIPSTWPFWHRSCQEVTQFLLWAKLWVRGYFNFSGLIGFEKNLGYCVGTIRPLWWAWGERFPADPWWESSYPCIIAGCWETSQIKGSVSLRLIPSVIAARLLPKTFSRSLAKLFSSVPASCLRLS